MCKYLNIMRAELLWRMYFPHNSPVDPLFAEDNSREWIPDFLDSAETCSDKNQSSLLEFDSKNIRINYDFLVAIHHRKTEGRLRIIKIFLLLSCIETETTLRFLIRDVKNQPVLLGRVLFFL